MALRIEDYALIGDCETGALVGLDGSIDWLCWPRFDSPACFASLLGTKDNGRWLISPRDGSSRITRTYKNHTLILETHFETASGAVKLTDFMPLRDRCSNIIRIVAGEHGKVAMYTEIVLRFGYGSIIPWVTHMEDGTLRAIAGPDMVTLHTPVHLTGRDFTTVGNFTVSAGETIPFVLSYTDSTADLALPVDHQHALKATESFWLGWSAKCREAGEYTETVVRSLITLKALTFEPTGAVVAAATTSLPEEIGGVRNWDYRLCWLRDATLTLLALMNAGYSSEAREWSEWLIRAVAGSPTQIQIMYGLAGERHLIETELPWLPGYENSRPVRVGNLAHSQLQLDVFGEIMDAKHQARRSGLSINEAGWEIQRALLDHLTEIWKEPDEGIWEVRGGRQHFTHSKVMCWVAFDRAIKSAEMFGLDGPVDRWKQIRAEIHRDVCRQGYSLTKKYFVQSYGGDLLDASLLLMPAVGFLDVRDERVMNTIAAIERDLMVDGLVVRYDTSRTRDGLPAGEGAFLPCSFWLADAYILQGNHAKAKVLFDRLASLCNDVGLLSEEYDNSSKRMLGNFPQAFSHVALVNTAFNLTRAAKPVEQRASLATGT
jgi:GH15 family glucan-1,4-alpha-glucosidase